MNEINHDNLLSIGFEPCIFAPAYLSRYSYYLGKLEWNLGSANHVNWDDTKLLISLSSDNKSYIDYFGRGRFFTIDDIQNYCKENEINMVASKSPFN